MEISYLKTPFLMANGFDLFFEDWIIFGHFFP